MASKKFCFLLKNERNLMLNNICNRNKSFNSAEWLKRRETDIYVEKAKRENYRCRSAFKLIEIDDRYKLIHPGYKVLDVGAAPGSWSQVLATRTNSNGNDPKKPKGFVVATDLSYFYDIKGVITLPNLDFTLESTQNQIRKVLSYRKLDFVVSDMAPPSTGVKTLDQDNIIRLAYPVLIFSVLHLRLGGGCLLKILEGQHLDFVEQMKKFFSQFNYVKPNASYSSSSEIYALGRNFIGMKKNPDLNS